ncbi:D-alanyl-D-alanine carboxypeptidase-like protein [Dokdonia sp. Hel_I_63]|uniref:M15 family metallopeptidase n=1 Tax=unclassified Dokdonia TaxID=2615033 RepID=UPI00020A6D4D|nr:MULTISPECIES: M15 family metallopeptidase [unclassified Dokdonia]AEE18531.1 peptidase M15B and M15C DD-carboxypeptidase VanY/endolysin [Dokdonia sp. 4H-3-7-5]TVZ22239.1 D-alanyl-D-alanine carboxypeptidase-like protein [Dokdonia sp. Hel_I_63]
MNRRTFSKLTLLGAVAASLPLQATTSFFQGISEDELLGKGAPLLTKTSAYRLRPEAAVAYEEMKSAAFKEGIKFQVVSSYRDYNHQNRIWERKYKSFRESGLNPTAAIEKIIQYSTIPGTSRHHWGTDIDIVDATPKVSGGLLIPSKFHGNGPFCKFKEWMDNNANTYGFYLVYTDNQNRNGFNYEPWHYSFKSLSLDYLNKYQELPIKSKLQSAKLLGSEHFTEAFIDRYLQHNVMDINPALRS